MSYAKNLGRKGSKDMVASLIPEGVQAPLITSSTDEDIDEYVKSSGHSWNHPGRYSSNRGRDKQGSGGFEA
jgi:hypothetical protein